MQRLFRFSIVLLVLSVCSSNLFARTWYIKPDGTGDAPTIQAGIDSAAVNDTVLLADGTFKGIGNRDIDFLGKTITVTSENGRDSTIIDCEGLGRGFVFQNNEDASSILSGVTIQNGDATEGGGVYCFDASPTITGNTFSGNNANYGGGIYHYSTGNYYRDAVVTDNILIGNSATSGGGVYSRPFEGGLSISNNTLIGNSANNGGGICCESIHDTGIGISNNTISENSGGGIYCSGWSRYSIAGNTVNENTGYGINATNTNYPGISNNTLSGNDGPGMILHSYNPTVSGNTISDNDGHGIYSSSSQGTIANNTISENNNHGIYCDAASHVISDNIIRNNAGCGISCWDIIFYPTITNNFIMGNGSDGIHCWMFASPLIAHNTLSENVGIAIRCEDASPTIESNILNSNGAGISCLGISSPSIIYNTICKNNGIGILCLEFTSPTITNNTLYGNTSHGIYCSYEASPTIENTIIAFSSQGQGIFCIYSSPPAIPPTPTLTCCDIYGNAGGDSICGIDGGGNIFEDPLLCDPETSNFCLSSNSPCLCGPCGQIGAFGQGCLGPLPRVISIEDICDDQGGRVRIIWEGSSYDAPDDTVSITGYGIYRRKEQSATSLGIDNELLSYGNLTRVRIPQLDGWDYVATVPARGDSVYQLVAQTLCDSIAVGGICWTAFFISAMTPDPLEYYDSPMDSGYSVDNLVPHLPTGFFGVGVIEGGPTGLKLSWDANRDPDISHYSLYKGLSEDFVPDESNYLGSTDGNSYFDESWTILDQYHYKLAAVDNRGNVSPYSVLRPAEIVIGVLLQSYSASYTGSVIEVTWTLKSPLEQSTQHILRASNQEKVFTEISKPIIIQNDLTYTFRDEEVEPGLTYKYRVEIEGDVGQRMLLFETENIATPTLPLTLYQNIPNPFNPSTTITYYLPENCPVTLEIFDSAGRLISKLLDNGIREKGMNSIEWRGTDEHGRTVASGVYFYRLIAGKEIISKKMVLLK